MSLDFSCKEDQKPLYLLGAKGHPYEDLEKVSGGQDEDPQIRELASIAHELQQRALSVSAILPGRVDRFDPNGLGLILGRELLDRLKTGESATFLMGDAGEDLFVASRDLIIKQGTLQSIGGFGRGITERLEEMRAVLQGLPALLLDMELPSLGLSSGDLLVETGAGADMNRILVLEQFAGSRGARLVCHDPISAAAQYVYARAPQIPYVALPQFPPFFGAAFEAVAAPKVVTLNDVLSSMGFGAMEDFAFNVGRMNVRNVSISQRLSFTENTPLLPVGYDVGQSAREEPLLAKALTKKILSARATPMEALLLSRQFDVTVRQLLTELVYIYLAGQMKEAGLIHARRSILEATRDLSQPEALAFLAQRHPGLLPSFNGGAFNTVLTGPFNNELSLNTPGVPSKHLRLRVQKTVVQFSKGPFSAELLGKPVPWEKTFTPSYLRNADPRMLLDRVVACGISSALPSVGATRAIEVYGKQEALDFVLRFVASMSYPIRAAMAGGVQSRLRTDFA